MPVHLRLLLRYRHRPPWPDHHLSSLTCVNESVCSSGFIGRRRFYYVLPAFDHAIRSCSVGHLLLAHLITHCSSTIHHLESGRGDYAYKTWATTSTLLSYERCHEPRAALLYRQTATRTAFRRRQCVFRILARKPMRRLGHTACALRSCKPFQHGVGRYCGSTMQPRLDNLAVDSQLSSDVRHGLCTRSVLHAKFHYDPFSPSNDRRPARRRLAGKISGKWSRCLARMSTPNARHLNTLPLSSFTFDDSGGRRMLRLAHRCSNNKISVGTFTFPARGCGAASPGRRLATADQN